MTSKETDELAGSILRDTPTRKDVWTTVRTIAYDGRYDGGPNYDRRACGGVVHIQERTVRGKVQRRAVTSNGRFTFTTPIAGTES